MSAVVPVVAPAWLPAPGAVVSVGLASVLPVEGRLDVDDGGVAELVLPEGDADAVAMGSCVLAALGLAVAGQGPPVALAFLLLVALTFAVAEAEAEAEAVLGALLLAVAVEVAVLVAEAVPVADELSLGLTLVLPLPALSLAVPLAGAVPEPAGVTLGVCGLPGLAGLAAVADVEGDGQTVAFALARLAGVLAGPAPPFAEPAALPEPARLGGRPLALDEEIPTADPSWTKASRSGGSARTTPMANTAQAPARIGLISPSRQSRGRCRP